MEISEHLIGTIRNLPKPTVVAVSGFGGSGKSTVAKKLAEKLGAPVIGVDSFQKKGAFDTQFSLWGIMDFVRLEEQVLKPFFKKENVVRYGNFNAKTETISETVEFKNEGVLVIEGVGLFRPELANYLSYKIWVDVPLEEAIARGKKRDREVYHNPTDECWDGVWKENDLEYYTTFKPKESADFVLKNI
jgi:uridine kinase